MSDVPGTAETVASAADVAPRPEGYIPTAAVKAKVQAAIAEAQRIGGARSQAAEQLRGLESAEAQAWGAVKVLQDLAREWDVKPAADVKGNGA